MELSQEIINLLILASVFFILGLGELIHRICPAKPELSRKSMHFLSGLTALSLPYLFQSHWPVLVLALGSSCLLLLGKKSALLKSVHDVGESTEPSISRWPYISSFCSAITSPRSTLWRYSS